MNKMMITYTEFEKYILLIKSYHESDQQLSDILRTEGFITYNTELIGAVSRLLSKLTNDGAEWIDYWLWECDFGVRDMEVYDTDGNLIPFTTIQDLYRMLMIDCDNE